MTFSSLYVNLTLDLIFVEKKRGLDLGHKITTTSLEIATKREKEGVNNEDLRRPRRRPPLIHP